MFGRALALLVRIRERVYSSTSGSNPVHTEPSSLSEKPAALTVSSGIPAGTPPTPIAESKSVDPSSKPKRKTARKATPERKRSRARVRAPRVKKSGATGE